jgi:hypothetical protein
MDKTGLVADRSSFFPTPGLMLQRKCACGSHSSGGECGECAKKKSPLQRAAAGPEASSVPSIVGDVLRSGGRPLDAHTRAFMEPRFGRDFSRVRVHTDTRAAESAGAVNARAYTVGNDIAFAAGRYEPRTEPGLRLIAHELTHTIQQESRAPGLSGKLEVTNVTDPSEREADNVAQAVISGGNVPQLNHAGIASVQRFPDDPFGPREGLGRGGTLPYREATELAKCIKIMGEESSEYCREEVLGEKPPVRCPSSYTIPDDVYKAIGVAWGKSKHGEAAVQEHGGRIVVDKDGKRVIRTGSGGGGSISLPAEKPGDVTTGTFHTHPYSASEGSTLGVAFSGGDITNFIGGGQGSVKYIGAGSCYFVLDTLNFTDRDRCQKVDTTKRWDDAFAGATGTFQEKVETAVQAAILGCGLCFYKTCRPDDASPVPKQAKLV